jgi:hypothetical protein
MRFLPRIVISLIFVGLAGGLLASAAQFRRFRYEEEPMTLPADANEKTEWAFARLRYDSYSGSSDCFRGGWSRWTVDAPKADRQFVQGVRRLTRLHTRSVEQVVDPDNEELFNWPWIYAVEVGSWGFDRAQAQRMREYLLKGGFLMVDDFHGSCEWSVFLQGIRAIFPDRPIEEIENNDEIFHTLYDLQERFQVPGIQFLRSGRTYERDGVEPKWRAIRDDDGRIMVAICHNMDLGDAWEWADSPYYPERYTSLAYRLGINYIIYSMTH